MIEQALINGLTVFFMQLGSRNFNFNFTSAQEKLLKHDYVQVFLLIAMFYAPTRNIVLSILIVGSYYLIKMILLNEFHPLNIYSKNWLIKEGFVSEDTVEKIKNNYIINVSKKSY
jgi:hypothetical protein